MKENMSAGVSFIYLTVFKKYCIVGCTGITVVHEHFYRFRYIYPKKI